MFKPTDDRVEYGAELTPPPGFHLVRAVATTYSLDFETLLAALIPLGLSGDIDDGEMKNPIALLQAIRKVTGKLVIFCEAGQIKAPKIQGRILGLLDDIVVQVALPRRGKLYPSFHPKTWTIEYENAIGERHWRFIVLSRNLTNDRSWDVVVSLEGERRRGSYGATGDLKRFLEYLRGRVYKGAGTPRQKKVVEDMIVSLDGVSFFCEHPFDGFDIQPFGIGEDNPDIFRSDDSFSEIVLISPFLSPDLICKINNSERAVQDKRRVLITRSEAIGKLQPGSVDKFEKYFLRQICDEVGERCDLHAKVYLRRCYSKSELWIGSANATESGMRHNVEMMVVLYGPNRYLNSTKFLNEICGGAIDSKSSPLELVEDVAQCREQLDKKQENDEREAEMVLKDICRMKMTAHFISDDLGKYRVWIEMPKGDFPLDVSVWPLGVEGGRIDVVPHDDIRFNAMLPLEDLSSFFVFEVVRGSVHLRRVIKILADGIPEKRDDAILNEIVKDRPSLLRYLAMLLSPNATVMCREIESAVSARCCGANDNQVPLPGLYEEMLRTAADEPNRISEAGYILSQINGDDELLNGYRRLYETFAEALNLEKEITHG